MGMSDRFGAPLSSKRKIHMSKGIKRSLEKALDRVQADMAGNAGRGGMYARGLSTEGYAGGYYQALLDVKAMLDGHFVPDTRGYWADSK